MSQLVVGRDLPNLKICVDNAITNEKVKSVEMEVEEKNNNSETEDNAVQVNINWESVGIAPHKARRYENKYAFFVSEMKLTAEELQKKLEERAARFGVQLKPRKQICQAQIDDVYESINLDVKNLETSSEEKGTRLEALHIHGVTEMSTNDIFDYFKDCTPAWIEWVNDASCNVVWLEQLGAVMALLKLSRPISVRKKNDITPEDNNDKEGPHDVIIFSEDELTEAAELPPDKEVMSKEMIANEKMADIDMEETKPDNPSNQEAACISMPPGQWRLGMSHPKAKTLLFRFSTKDDKKIPGAEKHSDYYKKYGNPNFGGLKGMISTTRKRKFRFLKEQKELKRLISQNKVSSNIATADNDQNTKNKSDDSSDDKEKQTEVVKRPRMRMHADDEESNQKKKNGVHERLGKRTENASLSDTTDSESDDLEDSNIIEPDLYRQSSVWDRLEGMSSIRPASRRTGDRQDLRSHLNDSLRPASLRSSGRDLRSKLQRLRQDKEDPEAKHRSPMLSKPYQETN